MKIYKDWKVYKPLITEQNKSNVEAGVMFLCDSDGIDWYELSKELEQPQHQNNYFILVDVKTNMVKSYSKGFKPWYFAPISAHFCITDSAPDDFEENYIHYRLDKNKFVPDNSLKIDSLKYYIDEELMWASSQISSLQDIEEFGTPTKEEQERLLALRKYRFTLTRVVPEDNPDIDLPDRP
ncbi:tail fiber assembly protein [Salmonella enterica]